jgi:tetratricopeptide (TPR) repeat protein
MDRPPPEPLRAARKSDLADLRIANLHRELEADPDPMAKAAILYHIGSLHEHDLDHVAEALRCYEQSAQMAPSFEPALIAQLRIAERGSSATSAHAACASMVAEAQTPALHASALVDLALRSNDWASLLQRAIDDSPVPVVPALLLEWLAEAAGDRHSVDHALRAQARHASDPALAAALWLDVALNEIERGEVDGALDALERASESPLLAWSARGLQRRLSKEHQRWDVLIDAGTSMASMLEDAADAGGAPDPLCMPVPESERRAFAALLWREAARCSADEQGDLASAMRYLESALRLTPEDPHTRLQALSLAERSAEDRALDHASAWFRERAPTHPAFVAWQIRRALSCEDERQALERLRETADRHPSSAFARAALDVALMHREAAGELAHRLRERADQSDGEWQQLLLWRAAQMAGASDDGGSQAELLNAAAAHERWNVPILRDAWGLALAAKRADEVVARCDDLLECDLDANERALLGFSKYDATQNALGQGAEAERLLWDALGHGGNESWAPHIGRVRGALGGDPALLATAHEALSELTDGEARTAHLCAAGEAHARAGDWSAARRVIRLAAQASPHDEYVLALLDGVLRESGQSGDVLALARERAQPPGASAELSLLLAGANAERNGSLAMARDAYAQALDGTPSSVSAALALADVARRQQDPSARSRAYASLADGSLEGGARELFALLQGDIVGLEGADWRRAGDAYEKALDHPVTAPSGAIALLSMPWRLTGDETRASAEEALGDAVEWAESSTDGFAMAYGGLRASLGLRGASTGDAWLELAALAPTDALRADALLQGIRTSRIAAGEAALDDLFILAQEASDLAQAIPEAAIVLDEALAPGDDPELRAAALERRLAHGTAFGRGAVVAAYGRALVEAERSDEALALLSQIVEERPDDLATWELLRCAARQAEQWPLVAQACERLAQFVEGSLKADLLEEAAVVRLDCMEQHQQAEDLLRSALDADPKREMAFRRLRDLLAEKEDAEALEALVSARLSLDEADDRADLLYERARLLRGFSDRPGALEALDQVLATEPHHAGALALAAEVHVSLEQWEEAVACLRRLAGSSIPDEQRRLAHLGAADFLETRLGAKDQALAELRAIDALGLADAETLARIGALEEEAGRREAAIEADARALELDPTHSTAIAGLARLLDGMTKQEALARYEKALWGRIEAGGLDGPTLRGLCNAADWRGQTRRASTIRAIERILGVGSSEAEPASLEWAGAWSTSPYEPDTDPVLREALRRVAPSLPKPRLKAKRAEPNDAVCVELERLCEGLGERVGSVSLSPEASAPVAHAGPEGEIHWVVPTGSRDGLDARTRFVAGRLCWAAPRGVAWLLDDSTPKAAGKIGALLRAARCSVDVGEAMLPAAAIKLRRSARRSVQQAVGDTRFDASALLTFAQSVQRSADRAGLLASGDLRAALAIVLHGSTTISALRGSGRGLDLARFCLDAESPLWRTHARG